MRALFVFTPAESKRLIGKAVARMEEVKRAKEQNKILIGHGSTNVFVGEEKPPILVPNRGNIEPPAATMADMLKDFGRDSIFIKGANAVDIEGNAAAFMAHPEGGTIGWAIGTILARGIRLIVPVGLEKLIPSVKRSVSLCGQQTFDYCQGLKVGLISLTGAKVVTEVEALRTLAGAESFQVASGGCSGSEGAVTLVAEGETAMVKKAIQIVEAIKGEPPLKPRKGICQMCVPSSPAQPKDYKFDGLPPRCPHEGKAEEEIPPYLRNR